MRKVTTKDQEIQEQPRLFEVGVIENRKIEAAFDAPDLSQLGGLLLASKDSFIHRFIDGLADCVDDRRDPSLTRHPMSELIRQRVGQIACGYEDCNDCGALRGDSMLKMFCGAGPEGSDLASQPTMTRLENSIGTAELYLMAEWFVKSFIASYDKPPKFIIIDADDTNADVYGAQQLSLFNAYYKEYCYMPLLLFEGLSGKMILPLLRPGRRNKTAGVFSILRRVITALHEAWPKCVIKFRGDSHFCCRELMDWAHDAPWLRFVTGIGSNPVLLRMADKTIKRSQTQYEETKRPQRLYCSFVYKAESWTYPQRVVCKAEWSSLGENVRFIVTSQRRLDDRICYDDYRMRGQCELDIKQIKEIRADRMSCRNFKANTFRLFLYAAAYVMLHRMKTAMFAGKRHGGVTNAVFLRQVMLTPVHVKAMKTKIKISLPPGHKYRSAIERLLAA